MITNAERGRANRAKGAAAERALATWLRRWYPDACRAVRNTRPDPGDIDGTSPDLWWSVRYRQVERIGEWLDELDAKREGRLGLLVVRRVGHTDPGSWWCWLRLVALADLFQVYLAGLDEAAPVRLELRDVMPLLVSAGFAGSPR